MGIAIQLENPQHTHRYPSFIEEALKLYQKNYYDQSYQGEHILHSKTPNANAIFFTSNDYLHISQHPDLLNAKIAALNQYGNGMMQSPVFLEQDSLFNATETKFATFLNVETCLLSQSGWCANTGLIQALAKPNLPVYIDFYAHMSFWEGIKAAGAKPVPFSHNDIQSLRKRLERFGPGLIAIDAIYSTTGTICPLKAFLQLAKEYDCLLIIDESHTLGAYGPNGQGLTRALGITTHPHSTSRGLSAGSSHFPSIMDPADKPRGVDVMEASNILISASLSKTLSGRGGLVAGDKALIQLIRHNAFPTIFSSALLPHDLAGFQAALDIVQNEPWRRAELHQKSEYLRGALKDIGCDIGETASQIIPLMTYTEKNTIALKQKLENDDIYGAVFCAPATPKNSALIRLSVNAHHTQQQLDHVIACIKSYGYINASVSSASKY